MNLHLKTLFFMLIFIVFSSTAYAAESSVKITMMTESYPPFNMKIDGKLQGIGVDVLQAMLEVMNSDQTINDVILTNWSRAYSTVLKRKDSMVFVITRTAKREALFKWIGPIAKTTICLIAPKNKNISINKISDVDQYRIGTVLQDIGEQILLEAGVDKKHLRSISGINCIDLSFKKMENNRIDMFAYEINSAQYEAKRHGHDFAKFEAVYTLKEGELYFAFNKETDEKVIAKWQQALEVVKESGQYAEILKKY